jgi:sterol desaturase/sphingolipid hydroxylase (fatty acid hydroxylase superfamily)
MPKTMRKKYVSNAPGSVRMFRSDLLESLSKVPFYVPLLVYVPVILFFSWKALFAARVGGWAFAGYFALGLLAWTLIEYGLHRFVFHYHPRSAWGQRVHFIFHGVHHDYPNDARRLVMPPAASIPLAVLFYLGFDALLSEPALWAFYPGLVAGYLAYDMSHYAFHHASLKHPLLRRLKKHHLRHHYADDTRGFGVSSTLWDAVFRSGYKKGDMRF